MQHDTCVGSLNGLLPSTLIHSRRPGKYRYERVVNWDKKGPRMQLARIRGLSP
jgi:hypothetical protein